MKLTTNGIIWLVLCFLIACTPEGELVIVPDNTAPPDLSVPEVLQENYVNKLYITLLGRKPTDIELFAAKTKLAQGAVSEAARQEVIEQIVSQEEYLQRTYELAKAEILLNLDTFEITQNIYFYTALLDSPAYEPFYGLIEFEISRMQDLKDVPSALLNASLTRIEMQRRMVNNLFYDQINMGSQNFVLAMFEYFLGRYPTEAELANSTAMVDGGTVIVFGKEGYDKQDFLDLFFDSDDYYEGQVINIYQDFLFREPNSQEMSQETVAYRQDQNYENLLKRILSTDEYLGL
ncbi:MAG: hypothetical protein AAFN10_06790 [Bacteroidota bacterium]